LNDNFVIQAKWACPEIQCENHPEMQPHLDYLAPEFCGRNSTCTPGSDMFSLGMLTYTAFNEGKPYFFNNGNFEYYRKNTSSVSLKSTSKSLYYFLYI